MAQDECAPPPSLATALQNHPTASVEAELGDWFAGHDQAACAAAAFSKAVAMEPASPQYTYLLGVSLTRAGKPREAIGPLEHSLQIDSRSLDTHLVLGSALEQTGDRNAAELQWRLALSLDSKADVALDHLSRDLLADQNYNSVIELLRPLATSAALKPEALVDLSVAYTKSGMVDEAYTLLRPALTSEPSSLPIIESYVSVLVLQSRYKEALDELSDAMKEHPSDKSIQVLYLRTLVLAHDPGAEANARKLLSEDPHQWEVLYLMGEVRSEAGDYSGARGYLEESVTLNPENAESRYRLGVTLAALHDNSGAKEQLNKAIALGMESPEVHFELAKTLRALGDRAEAEQQNQLSREIERSQAQRAEAAAKVEQADAAGRSGDLQKAAEEDRAALALDPTEPLLAYKLAIALDKLGDRAAERAALEQAIRLDPRMALAQNQLGYLDSVDGDIGAAIQHFQLAIGADAGFAKAWMNLAAALCLESKWHDARDPLAHVLALEPSNTAAQRLLQQIDAMDAQH